MGNWKTNAMVKRYAHLANEQLREGVRALDAVCDGHALVTSENDSENKANKEKPVSR